MSVTGKDLVKEATKYLGEGGDRFWKAYGWSNVAWCCMFQWYIFKKCGVSKLFYNGQKTAYVPTITTWLKANCKHVTMADAQEGDLVIFTWDGKGNNKEKGNNEHIGMIRKKGSSKIAYTIEGNTLGSKVANRTREAKYIYGIYRPNFVNVEKDKAVKWEKRYEVIKKTDIFKKASTTSKKVKTVTKGTAIKTTKKKGSWVYIKDLGWIQTGYLKEMVYYTVQKGDTLTAIAKKYGTTVKKLKTMNKIENVNLIHPGQKFRVR